ncbi:MAG TPA: HAMP domain-containing sensor histidine kinase [Candidatus Acidoferrales bacterium]|nr:HAMP domain-containing sensor histidine kinase [Candidatus Acidoferrales bacterium]
MRSRYLTLFPIFICTILFGAYILWDQSARNIAETYYTPDTATTWLGRLGALLSAAIDSAIEHGFYLWRIMGGQGEILLYGGLAFIGIIMTVLVIRSGKETSKEELRIQALLKDLTTEKEKAQNLARLKSEFLNQVSHELRTPLAVIMGYIDCMLDGLYGQVDAKHQEILKAVSKQSVDLKEMIDRILTFSRLEADKARLRIESFALNKVVADLRDTYNFIGQQKGIAIHWELPKQDCTLQSDPERIKEILNNLIQNAVKFTSQGSVSIRVQSLAALDSVVFEVSDTGMGIPREQLNSIFEPFMQVHKTSTVNARGGIGLGLSIVKKHVEQLRGNIDVQSELGKGTTFRIVLPRMYETPAAAKKPFQLLKFLRNANGKPSNRPMQIGASPAAQQTITLEGDSARVASSSSTR